VITRQQVRTAIEASLAKGDDVMIHASLGRLGNFEDGVDALIQAILAAVGETGTVIMMTDTRSFAQTGRFSMVQPSETGLLTERFRLTPGVIRSCVPMVSFCASGPRSSAYTERYHSHLDETATITRLLENNGKIMLMGVGYDKCTLYHLAEERHSTKYNFYKDFEGVLTSSGEERPISQRYFVRRDMSLQKDPSIAGYMLESRGQAKKRPLGAGLVRTFRARDFDDCCMRALDADPDAFVANIPRVSEAG
jgi:aminoglycoside N3'-acetyltransferase